MNPKRDTKLIEMTLLVFTSPLQMILWFALQNEPKELRGILKIAQYDNYKNRENESDD